MEPVRDPRMKLIAVFLDMIKFSHTIFALPFAYLGYIMGSEGIVIWSEIVWVTLAMIAARTAGMCLNRLIDRDIDAKNERTRFRALVTGDFSSKATMAITSLCLILLILSAAQLNRLCLYLSPAAVGLLVSYHYLKRFTVFCHFGIGLVLACAPMGGWIAATGAFETGVFCLGLAVLFWVAGFDIFYSLQDVEFDRQEKLCSIPSRLGIVRGVQIARLCHLFTLFFLVELGIMLSLNSLYWAGLALAATILAAEHFLMRRAEKQNVHAAFFTLNGILSITFFISTGFSLFI
jgi:4-hydroxybenzoate polyprenyltransferase